MNKRIMMLGFLSLVAVSAIHAVKPTSLKSSSESLAKEYFNTHNSTFLTGVQDSVHNQYVAVGTITGNNNELSFIALNTAGTVTSNLNLALPAGYEVDQIAPPTVTLAVDNAGAIILNALRTDGVGLTIEEIEF